MEFKIEKDIEMPSGKGTNMGVTSKLRAAISNMDVGDSFEFSSTQYTLLRMTYNPIHNDPSDTRHFITKKVAPKLRRCWRTV